MSEKSVVFILNIVISGDIESGCIRIRGGDSVQAGPAQNRP